MRQLCLSGNYTSIENRQTDRDKSRDEKQTIKTIKLTEVFESVMIRNRRDQKDTNTERERESQ
jgi:hypothetical protein